VDLKAAAPAGQTSGVDYLLFDHQVGIVNGQRSTYRHSAAKALNLQGVESLANLEIRFDPSYQSLTIHSVVVHRGEKAVSRLNPAAVRVIQREKELEALIYDGSKTASLFLEDVRVGDVIEYAYTLRGSNPVFGHTAFGSFDLQWNVPVAHVHARLHWPQARPLKWVRFNEAAPPAVSSGGGYTDYRWDLHNVSRREVDSDAPGWFDPYQWVQWGEFGEWSDVARWAAPLYAQASRSTPGVKREVDRIAAAHAAPGERLLAALRFVQQEVRYLGIEMGPGSHAPSPPDVVLQRRFGDCKDKAQLLVALLRGLGLEADPALVNTQLRRGIEHWLPSPVAFNHVLVRARVDGRLFWVDPTRAPQSGTLENLVQADHDLALLVNPATTGLEPMAGAQSRRQQREIRSTIDASSTNKSDPVPYTVVTVLRSAAAESMRSALAATSREQIQNDFLNFYARYYDDISSGGPLEVLDDPGLNELTVTEHYLIRHFWAHAEKEHRFNAGIESPDIERLLRQPQAKVRTSPLALSHPVEVTSVTRVKLEGDWKIPAQQQSVEDPAFRLERTASFTGQTLELHDRFVSRAESVAPGDVTRYAANLEKGRNALNYGIHQGDGTRARAQPTQREALHWVPSGFAAIAAILALMLAARIHRWDPPAAGQLTEADYGKYYLVGIKGMLLLPVLLMVMRFFQLTKELKDGMHLFSEASWRSLTVPGGEHYDPFWAPALLTQLLGSIALLVLLVLLAKLFFQRRTSAPRVFIAFLIGHVALSVVSQVLVDGVEERSAADTAKQWVDLVGFGVVSAAWSWYFVVSERVQATFTRRLRPEQAVGAARNEAPSAEPVHSPPETVAAP